MNEREVAVCKLSEINDGEMKEVKSGETPILLARVSGKCYALAAHCTHYGAPLVEGALSGDRIVCPWHHACFNATNGHLEEPPALDELAAYSVRIEGDDIYVDLGEEPADRQAPAMVKRHADDERVFVVIGGGAAGYMAAQTLREDDFKGRVVIITRENRAPYDRPNLSKDYLQGQAEPGWMPLRSDDFFPEYDIEILLGREVSNVDPASKTITFEGGETLRYDSLLVATGGEPRKLDLPGSHLKNIFPLRSFDSSDAIIGAAKAGRRAVVIGASFIGMETACSLAKRGLIVTVVAPDKVPFEKVLGAEIGTLYRQIHESNGVEFRLGSHHASFEGDNEVTAVVLDSGERIEADLVVVGVGVTPATGFLTGVQLHKDGGVVADDHLSIGENIFAAGDIAHFPDARTGEDTRIEHWRTALQQGRVAAHNMAGKQTVFAAVPFFWTTQFDATLNYVGHVKEWDEIIFQGEVEKQDFLAFYVKDHRILAVAGMNRDRDLAVWEEMIRLNQVPSPDRLNGDPVAAWNL